ncbi:MAG: acyl-phosphate glycerol 3-phosphate acyltransferase [Candidatus Omnitrophota bacterium]|nr:MAG: acyl-phosphate glycerol 3-phosphate acyltransferase [Candidatus Omnitrophota bacterium]
MLKISLGILLSYLLGAVPAAYILVKAFKGVDIRTYGSGNVGATNASRILGKWLGAVVLAFDIFKGFFVVIILSKFFLCPEIEPEIIKACFGLAVVCGHIFNVFLSFNGGKGVATSAGVLLGIAPYSILLGAVCFVIVLLISRYVSVGSMVSSIVVPFYLLIIGGHYSYIVLSALLCILIVAKHKTNIKRLLRRSERKIFSKK